MASRLLRRSGVAVGLVAELLEWRADTMVEVGVGTKWEEIDVLRKEWDDLRIIAFEPHPKIYAGLGAFPGTVYPYAVGDRTGEAVLHGKSRHKDGSSLYPHVKRDDCEYEEYEVQMTTLDIFFPNVEGLSVRRFGKLLLWLDCEGSELDVLKGGERFIEAVDVVNVELTGHPPGAGWCDPNDVHDWLGGHGFYRQWIHTQRVHEGQTDGIYVKPHLFKPQFCCCPCEVRRYLCERDAAGISCFVSPGP